MKTEKKCIFSKGENIITQLMQHQKAQKCYKKIGLNTTDEYG
jgi:hypothetical protein